MVCPVTKEKPVRGCTVQWVCPNCSHCGGCDVTPAHSEAPAPAPSVTPAMPRPPAPPAKPSMLPPPPKTTDVATPDDFGTAQSGF